MVGTRSAGQSLSAIAAFLATATLAAGTITTSQPMTLTQTWNAAGVTFTAATVNVTDTASAAASKLLDLKVGGVSKASVDKTGNLVLAGNNIYAFSSTFFGANINLSSTIVLASTGTIQWNSDLLLVRDAANTLAQRNGTAAQASRIYFSWTDASNYTRLALKTATGIHTLETESAGTGESNIDLALTPKGTGRVRFGTHSALAAETVSGYITIKDAGGTERKVAVVS